MYRPPLAVLEKRYVENSVAHPSTVRKATVEDQVAAGVVSYSLVTTALLRASVCSTGVANARLGELVYSTGVANARTGKSICLAETVNARTGETVRSTGAVNARTGEWVCSTGRANTHLTAGDRRHAASANRSCRRIAVRLSGS